MPLPPTPPAPRSNLPSRGDALYNGSWWSLASWLADRGFGTGAWEVTLPTATSTAAGIAGQYKGFEYFDTPGFSQIFSRARQIANSSLAFTTADDRAAMTADMVGLAPWARPAEQMNAQPQYQFRAEVTYTDEFGTVYNETLVATDTVLSRTVGGMRNRLFDKLDAMLLAGENSRYPSGAVLQSVDRVTILAV